MNELYSGGEPVTLESGRTVSLAEACQIWEVDPIIKRFGTWAVTEYGVECLTTNYAIEKARLGENDWHRHMIGKTWTIAEDVCDALDYAREHFGKQPKREAAIPGIARRPRRQGISNRLRYLVMRRDRSTCQLCGRTAQQGYQMQVDHKTPRAKGGTDEIDNLQVLCSLCNSGKGVLE